MVFGSADMIEPSAPLRPGPSSLEDGASGLQPMRYDGSRTLV